MPKYSYRCIACGKEFEVERHYNDNSKQKCPKCKSNKTRKIIGVPFIQFHGSGFTLSKSE